MKIVITGDSHTGPLQRGIELMQREGGARLDGVRIVIRPLGGGHLLPQPFFKIDAGRIRITQPEFRTRMEHYPPPDGADADFHALSAPLHTARVFRHPAWRDYALPGDEAGIPISTALLGRLVDDDQRHVMAFLKAMAQVGLRPLAIEGPLPFRHHPAVQAMGAEKILRIDRFYRDRLRAWLQSERIPVVAVPQDLVDEQGFMRDDMAKDATDAHHGNERFGARMIEQTIALARRLAC